MRKNWIRLTFSSLSIVLLCTCLVSCTAASDYPEKFPPSSPEIASRFSLKLSLEINRKAAETDKVLTRYKEFLKSDEMYSLTATAEYPRGDSQAVYAFGDCNGDGIPELHIDGGGDYHIYTFHDNEVVPFYVFELPYVSEIMGLKDGSFVGTQRSEQTPPYTSFHKIPSEDEIYEETRLADNASDHYYYMKLDFGGHIIASESHNLSEAPWETLETDLDGNTNAKDSSNYPENGWENNIDNYKRLLEDESLHLTWEYIFPEKEWNYLDSMEEGNGVLTITDSSKEWKAYEHILSGNFSFTGNIEDRSLLSSWYRDRLDPNSGRSSIKYILLDVNGDGIRDLFIRYDPGSTDYSSLDISNTSRNIACFSYKDGNVDWWSFHVHEERYVPLKNGQILFMSQYGNETDMMIGRWDEDFIFIPEKVFKELPVTYREEGDEEWYKGYFIEESHMDAYTFWGAIYHFPPAAAEEGIHHFAWDTSETGVSKEPIMLSEEEWAEIERSIEELLIPDSEWNPASVFMPNRCPEEFGVG